METTKFDNLSATYAIFTVDCFIDIYESELSNWFMSRTISRKDYEVAYNYYLNQGNYYRLQILKSLYYKLEKSKLKIIK